MRKYLVMFGILAYISASARSTKYKSFGCFAVFSDSLNTDFNLWYNIRIIAQKDTFLIKDLATDNGSEFFIKPSKNGKFFVLDNIIKGWVEINGKRELHENYKCVIVSVKTHKVVQELQSACGGKWNGRNIWIDNDGTEIYKAK